MKYYGIINKLIFLQIYEICGNWGFHLPYFRRSNFPTQNRIIGFFKLVIHIDPTFSKRARTLYLTKLLYFLHT